jgi:hypothetical protein
MQCVKKFLNFSCPPFCFCVLISCTFLTPTHLYLLCDFVCILLFVFELPSGTFLPPLLSRFSLRPVPWFRSAASAMPASTPALSTAARKSAVIPTR